ncbi:hypothetical protein LTR37_002668 [Vermiconidia calcicola]|uniref:Uncharacterized protein n=1 Tax=Vermiconidia calcicola TaxID=1690605 RepID=A0ACC3NSJ2_9PEZI|nr:hypothetical protein LTR37_002668 [Vermiconidia calcicola]
MLLSAEELKKSSEIDPAIVEFAKNNPTEPLNWGDAGSVFTALEEFSKQGLAMIGEPESSVKEEFKDIPMRDGFQSTLKIHRPTEPPADGSPLIIFCFGGGFIAGDMHAGTTYARAFVRLFGAVVVNISYRLAPKYKFPVSWHDGIDSAKWLAEHASEVGADPSKGFVVGGISAGGNLSSVITNASIEEKFANPITGQWLCVPSLMDENSVPEKYKPYFLSMEHNVDAPVLPSSALHELKKHIESDDDSPLRHPVLNKAVPLSKLPPTYLQADGLDPIRDDALIYEEMLKEAGVKTKIDFYPGCPHAHFAFMPGIEVSNKATADIMVGMGWLLGRSVAPEDGLRAMGPAA